VASQLLLRTADGKGRVAALELLLRTTGLANVIREGNTPMINSIIQGGKKEGMQSMDDALYAFAQAGRISGEDAWLKAINKKRFEEFAPPGIGATGAALAAQRRLSTMACTVVALQSASTLPIAATVSRTGPSSAMTVSTTPLTGLHPAMQAGSPLRRRHRQWCGGMRRRRPERPGWHLHGLVQDDRLRPL